MKPQFIIHNEAQRQDERKLSLQSVNPLASTMETYNIDRIDFNAMRKGTIMMELAKITMRGQITIPADIRKKLGVRDGDKVVFVEENGRIVMENAAMLALKTAQNAFRGEADRLGLKTEQDVVNMVKEVRRTRRKSIHASHD